MMRALVMGLLVLAASVRSLLAAEPDSPLTWRAVSEPANLTSADALDLARSCFGDSAIDAGPPTLVRLSDRNTLGVPVNDVLAYLVRFDVVSFARSYAGKNDTMATGVIVAIDASTGTLILAFTPPSETWMPILPTPDRMEDDTEKRMTLSRARMPVESSLRDVFAACFERGKALFDAGQLVVRPRWAARKFPALPMDGNLVSIATPSNVWLVHGMGAEFNRSYGPPPGQETPMIDTGVLYVVLDGSLEFVEGAFFGP
jgi:hypothetical protein